MKRSIRFLFFAAIALSFWPLLAGRAQSPAPVIIQAATPAPIPAAPAPAAALSSQADAKTIMQTLQDLLSANAETIKKQEAALEMLDSLQKAAEDIKIYSKRG